jgi:hypothetical protein
MSLDLNKLENKLDEALSNETSETLNKFLNDKRMTNKQTKPPLGLMPHSVFLLRRLEEIFQAIERYYEESMQIPIEWIEEYNLLIEMYKNNLGNNEQQ